jgi:zinc transporter ZupT
MSDPINIVVSTFCVSLFSLIGIFVLSMREKTLDKVLLVLIAFSVGTILGAADFDLLPEALEVVDESAVFIYIAAGFVAFFFLESVHLLALWAPL